MDVLVGCSFKLNYKLVMKNKKRYNALCRTARSLELLEKQVEFATNKVAAFLDNDNCEKETIARGKRAENLIEIVDQLRKKEDGAKRNFSLLMTI